MQMEDILNLLKDKDKKTTEEPVYIVIGNGFMGDDIYYYGESEIEAHRHYKRAIKQGSTKTNIHRGYVTTCKLYDVTMIESYEILETIK